MNQIKSELKYAHWIWDEDKKIFILVTKDADGSPTAVLELNKTYAFSFVRFVLRIAQRNWFRKRISVNVKNGSVNVNSNVKSESSQSIKRKTEVKIKTN